MAEEMFRDRRLEQTHRKEWMEPAFQAPYFQGPGPDTEPRESLLMEYASTLSRHRRLIAEWAFASALLLLLLGIGTLPLYRARTSLEIQGLNSDFMNMRNVAPTGENTAGAADMNIQTQIKLLQSETLSLGTIERLQAEPHPQFVDRDDLLSRAGRLVHPRFGTPIAYTDLVEDAAKRVKVKPLGMTRLVEVTCDSWNADFSARFCNTLVREFEYQDHETRTAEARKTGEWLTTQVAELKEKTEESQRRLEAATGGNGLILSQQNTTVGEDRLRQLQGELVKAQADRMEKEAESNVARGASVDTLPNVLDNPGYRAYQAKLADLHGRIAELVPPLTEDNPKVIHLRAQTREAEAGLEASTHISTGRQGNEFAAARHREDLLQFAYRTQESNVSSDLQKGSRVNLLRREVESEQQLYQTLLQRAKEAGFATALQASTVRVVDRAARPLLAFSPNRVITAIVGLALGSLAGIGFAFFKDRNSRVFRVPGDVQRYLHVDELGVIPTADRSRNIPGGAGRKANALSVTNGDAETLGTPGTALTLTRWNEEFSLAAEAYRNATFSILLSDSSKRARAYVVSSPSAGEGKTTVTSNLGVALSKSKLRVVLIDGDLRRPSLHNAFGVRNDFGLRNILRGEVALETIPVSRFTKQTSLPNLSIIPSGTGTEDIVELLHSSFVGGLLARLSRDFDVILIDTPPMLHMADARIFAGQTDGAILILRAGVTTRDQAAAARDLFDHDRVRLVGTILNDFDPTREGLTGYYESYYQYRRQAEASETASVGS